MNGGLIHNKKFNLVAFLSMGLFLLIGFIDIFSWIFIMLPVVVCFYVYDIRHGAVYLTCLLYTSPSPRDRQKSRMPSSA